MCGDSIHFLIFITRGHVVITVHIIVHFQVVIDPNRRKVKLIDLCNYNLN
jgi:hypothetical protein